MWKQLIINTIPRLSKFPYQVMELGYSRGDVFGERNMYNLSKFEVCLRLFSRQKETEESFDGVKYKVGFPHIVLKVPGVAHRFTVEEPRESIYFAYNPEMLSCLRQILPFPNVPIWDFAMDDRKNNLVTELYDLMLHTQEYGVADRIDLVAFQLLELLIFHQHEVVAHQDFYEHKIRRIASYFQLHFRENIDLNQLVRRHGMSYRTFARHWKDFFALTPGQYLLDLKLQSACRDLTGSTMKIKTVCQRLNFQETTYFCALFKSKFGLTPLQYRRKMSKIAQ